MLASNWCNDFNAYDANDDGFVTSADILTAVDDLNRQGSRELPTVGEVPYFIDINDDGIASPADLLPLIEELNLGERRQVIALAETSSLALEMTRAVTLPVHEGRHTFRFDVAVDFDTTDASGVCEDALLISLVDSENSSRTLLDRGETGTTLFSLTGDRAEYPPSFVSYDGQTVEIDVSSLQIPAGGRLLVQLVNHDGDSGSRIVVRNFVHSLEPQGTPSDVLPWLSETAPGGGAMSVGAMSAARDLHVELENVHLDTKHNLYTADIRVANRGDDTGRDVAVVFPNLPDGVQLLNASGADDAGNPLINMHQAIPAGGLSAEAKSRAVSIQFSTPNLTRFAMTPRVYTAGPNHAPTAYALGPLSVTPGAPLVVPLTATDADGDPVAFSLQPSGPMPDALVHGNQLVICASPAELGRYRFDLVASDGAARSVQTVRLKVVPDTETATRLSGMVLDTRRQPAANVSVTVGSFQTSTGSDGSFQLEFPTGKVPTTGFDIAIPPSDPYFDPSGAGDRTMGLRRAISDPASGDSPANPLKHPNIITSFIDASSVYGSNAHRAAELRKNDGSGGLKTSHGDLLPQNSEKHFPDGTLENENAGPFDPASLFVAGDVRASENPGLASLHTLLLREHNRKAAELAAAHPDWTGDEVYLAARRWVGGLIQHITYSEYLPMLLGDGAIPAYTAYDPAVDPGMSALFSTAAYRLGHSIVAPQFLLRDEDGNDLPGGGLPLRDAFFNPQPILDTGIEPILRGLAVQPAEELDAKVIDDLRNFLFGVPGAGGMDLVSMNLQRGRDMGLPSYNQARMDMGLEPVEEFADFTSDPELQQAFSSVYADVNQIDVWAGGLAEDHVAGAMLGPLFWTVVRDQFLRLRDGDRFWYENAQFTDTELAELRTTSLADVVLRNTSIAAITPTLFTTGPAPAAPPTGGVSAAAAPNEHRTFDGSGNNQVDPSLGQAGTKLRVDYSQDYGDGVSSPAGIERPSAREISNAVFAQHESIPSSEGATSMLVMWGQFIDHDIGLTPGGITDVMTLLGESGDGGDIDGNTQFDLPVLLGHDVYAGYNNVIADPLVLPPAAGG